MDDLSQKNLQLVFRHPHAENVAIPCDFNSGVSTVATISTLQHAVITAALNDHFVNSKLVHRDLKQFSLLDDCARESFCSILS